MNKKGFTLVELLAVLGLLSIIALMATPILLNQIDSQKKKNYENFVGDLCLSAEAYLNHTTNIDGIENFKSPGDTIDIKLGDLMKNGYVKSSTKNPKTKRIIKAKDTITVTITSNKTYSCELDTESDTPIFAPQSFATDSWATIAANTTSDKYKVGDEKIIRMDVNEDGNDETYHLTIVNKSAPSECSGSNYSQSACGFVVQFKELLNITNDSNKKMNTTATSVGGWPESAMYTYLNSTVYPKIKAEIGEIIINTKTVSSNGFSESSDDFVTSENDKLYLLSTKEVGLDIVNDFARTQTRKLDYYNDNTSRIKYNYGTSTVSYWWLRSADRNRDSRFLSITGSGEIDYYGDANKTYGVSPAFRIGEQ